MGSIFNFRDLEVDINPQFVVALKVCYRSRIEPGQLMVARKIWSETKINSHVKVGLKFGLRLFYANFPNPPSLPHVLTAHPDGGQEVLVYIYRA
jgi:hypothetical protein